MKKINLALILIIAVFFILSICFYPSMPEQISSHWNARGQADGTMPKFWGLFFLPLLTVALVLFFLFLPEIDPLKRNILKFRGYYDRFIVLLSAFLLLVHVYLILWNLGIRININLFIPILFGIMFWYIGVLFGHLKRNWLIGIRTPWTLSSEKVWIKTHKLGGKLFKLSGAISFAGILFRKYAMFFVIVPVILAAVYSAVYSYLEFRKENSRKNKK